MNSQPTEGLLLKEFKKPESLITQITSKNPPILPGPRLLEAERPNINLSSFSLNFYHTCPFLATVRGSQAKVSLNLAGVEAGKMALVVNFIYNVTLV